MLHRYLDSEPRMGGKLISSILGATGKISQLKIHVKGGLSNGLSEGEIRESMLHVMGYCGFPTGLDA
jgi:4-carboxymuconolactone decarboxylase